MTGDISAGYHLTLDLDLAGGSGVFGEGDRRAGAAFDTPNLLDLVSADAFFRGNGAAGEAANLADRDGGNDFLAATPDGCQKRLAGRRRFRNRAIPSANSAVDRVTPATAPASSRLRTTRSGLESNAVRRVLDTLEELVTPGRHASGTRPAVETPSVRSGKTAPRPLLRPPLDKAGLPGLFDDDPAPELSHPVSAANFAIPADSPLARAFLKEPDRTRPAVETPLVRPGKTAPSSLLRPPLDKAGLPGLFDDEPAPELSHPVSAANFAILADSPLARAFLKEPDRASTRWQPHFCSSPKVGPPRRGSPPRLASVRGNPALAAGSNFVSKIEEAKRHRHGGDGSFSVEPAGAYLREPKNSTGSLVTTESSLPFLETGLPDLVELNGLGNCSAEVRLGTDENTQQPALDAFGLGSFDQVFITEQDLDRAREKLLEDERRSPAEAMAISLEKLKAASRTGCEESLAERDAADLAASRESPIYEQVAICCDWVTLGIGSMSFCGVTEAIRWRGLVSQVLQHGPVDLTFWRTDVSDIRVKRLSDEQPRILVTLRRENAADLFVQSEFAESDVDSIEGCIERFTRRTNLGSLPSEVTPANESDGLENTATRAACLNVEVNTGENSESRLDKTDRDLDSAEDDEVYRVAVNAAYSRRDELVSLAEEELQNSLQKLDEERRKRQTLGKKTAGISLSAGRPQAPEATGARERDGGGESALGDCKLCWDNEETHGDGANDVAQHYCGRFNCVTVLQPCGHRLCELCAKRLQDSTTLCPWDRMDFVSVVCRRAHVI
ncbi:MAG: hypothetical protein BJ554DRAFT_6300 [Olpidium bornovanus]|uniref:RING-type domain-containing protein n=1 Tax=Olpidium bornovanus TaxID=278681 RepID=A0A8H8DMC2_9FUNG|nr:MAG: hypothetical protein BJ554DRAFT_6300 [Olpidium bornovanus]